MRPLAQHVLAADADRVAIVDTPAMYGLQFYLDGKLEHVTSAGLAAELDAMHDRLAGDPSRREVLLTTRGTPPLLARRCRDGSFECTMATVQPCDAWTLRKSP